MQELIQEIIRALLKRKEVFKHIFACLMDSKDEKNKQFSCYHAQKCISTNNDFNTFRLLQGNLHIKSVISSH